jgi:hypothetical protein
MPHSVFEVENLALQVAPLRQQKPQAVAAFRLGMGLTEPAGAHDMR